MGLRFYLSSQDLGDPRSWECNVVQKIKGVLRPNEDYLLVNIHPSIRTRFRDGPEKDYNQVIISLNGQNLKDVGKASIFCEIVLCPSYIEGVLDERECSKIGTGALHATYADALANDPWDH